MEKRKTTSKASQYFYTAIVIVSGIGLYFLGYFDPLPDREPDQSGVYVYFGPEGETVPTKDQSDPDLTAALQALEDTDYFGAVAQDDNGSIGVWTGARSIEVARQLAMASCGAGCEIVAERLPLHRDPERTERIATTAMAENLAVNWPFTKDVIAVGGANAWGHRSVPGGKTGRNRAKREAAADCEKRRAAENAPDPSLSKPCRIAPLEEIIDLRPKPEIYPAAYSIDLTALYPVEETEIRATEGSSNGGLLGPYLPPRLHGARAANDASSQEVVRAAGWPEAGRIIAAVKCNAERRPGEPRCAHTHSRVPAGGGHPEALAVTPDLFESFQAWEQTGGKGAFAISPYGVWGFSYDHTDRDEAIQKAADWCWYYTRKNWEYRQVNRAFLDAELDCRIVAIRD